MPRARRRRRDERGVALILVLGAITVLTVMLTEFQDDTSAELATAVADRDALKAEYLAKSGIELSRLLLAAEPTVLQAIKMSPFAFLGLSKIPQIPVWDYADGILGAFNDADGTDAFQRLTGADMSKGKNLGIEGGSFEVKIIEENSKININLAARGEPFSEQRLAMQLLALMSGDQYRQMFEQRDRDDQFSDRATICGAIIDWADPDENLNACDLRTDSPVASGSEDSVYQLLKRPYWRKNGAYDSLDELHLVRGISDDFWATFVDPDPTDPRKRIMTVWGQRGLNVNSANAQTILALVCAYAPEAKVCTDLTQAAKFIAATELFRSLLSSFPVFLSADSFWNVMQGKSSGGFMDLGMMFKAIGVDPIPASALKGDTKAAVEVKSEVFSIYATGVVPGYQRRTRVRIHVVVDRRGTPAPTYLPVPAASGANPTGVAPAATSTTGQSQQGSQGNQATGISWATQPDPGGTIIYYRQE